MLADRAKICVRGGHGGNGCVSFRREKYVPKGGPNGGDGGRGGDVVLVASRQVRDLARFLQEIHLTARRGGHGAGGNRHGADGEQLTVEVPVGTEVRTLSGELLADLAIEGAAVRVAEGGEGGRGNARFASSRRRAPAFAERGLPGSEQWLLLIMKLLADVGLVGLPNAGKSSLLAALTRAHPRIAPYPFTTIEPNLGALQLDDRQIVLADIPGLVEGASAGVGLGHEFLAHIERTALLVYIVELGLGTSAALQALRTVRSELRAFAPGLAERPAIIALSKRDLVDDNAVAEAAAALRAEAAAPTVAVSASTGAGIEQLLAELAAALPAPVPATAALDEPVVLRPAERQASSFTIEPEGVAYRVRGAALERIVAKADLDNDQAVSYVQEVMERAGVSDALRRAGAQPGDTVLIGDERFEFA
jgi:GTP-binding protein